MKQAFLLFAFLFSLIFLGCNSSTSSGLSAEEKLVLGTWSGAISDTILDSAGNTVEILTTTATMNIKDDHNYSDNAVLSGSSIGSKDIGSEKGTWAVKNGSYLTKPTQCQDAPVNVDASGNVVVG